jgi:hypothetical protein
MSLFQTKKTNSEKTAPSLLQPVPTEHTVLGRKTDVLSFLDNLEKGECIHFVTEGKWSSHEMLNAILRKTGASAVRISTYSMTEDPVRYLVNALGTGMITNLKVITDKRFKGQQAAAHQLASANFGVTLTDVHAKVMVIRNDEWSVTVMGSANFTRNKRRESGIVIESPVAAQFHWNWINGLCHD